MLLERLCLRMIKVESCLPPLSKDLFPQDPTICPLDPRRCDKSLPVTYHNRKLITISVSSFAFSRQIETFSSMHVLKKARLIQNIYLQKAISREKPSEKNPDKFLKASYMCKGFRVIKAGSDFVWKYKLSNVINSSFNYFLILQMAMRKSKWNGSKWKAYFIFPLVTDLRLHCTQLFCNFP